MSGQSDARPEEMFTVTFSLLKLDSVSAVLFFTLNHSRACFPAADEHLTAVTKSQD